MLNTVMRDAINIGRAIGANNFPTLKSIHYNCRNLITQDAFIDKIDFVSLVDMLQPGSIATSFKPYGYFTPTPLVGLLRLVLGRLASSDNRSVSSLPKQQCQA
ncbi:hypothetical protein DNK10_08995 [Pseudomonas daroniae]|nr:hypothetical protein DNK10_08995 [Pseudomonas daroniae]